MTVIIDGTNGVQSVSGSATLASITNINDTNTGVFFPASETIALATSGSERLRVDSAGNAGLGVTPSAWNTGYKVLQINNTAVSNQSDVNARFSQNLAILSGGASYITSDFATQYLQGSGQHLWYTAPSGTAGNTITFTQAMTLDASGNLLLGNTTSRVRLTLSAGEVGAPTLGTASGGAFFGNSTTAYGTLFGTSGTGEGWIQQQRVDASGVAYNLWLQPSGGNLLVGTTTDLGYSARLNVDSGGGETAAFKSSGGASSYVQRVWNSATSGDNLFVWFGTEAGGTTRGSITYNRGAGQVAYNTTSDARLKENIADAEEAGDKIDAMQVRQFDWKETGNHMDYGFIAQELNEVAPIAVTKPEDEEAMWSVDYSKLVPMLVKEIQSLRARLAAAGL